MEVIIETKVSSLSYLKNCLEREANINFLRLENRAANRGVDVAVLVALIGASGGTLAALITGLVSLRAQSKAQKIVLMRPDGTKIEIPVDCKPEQVSALLGAAEPQIARIVLGN